MSSTSFVSHLLPGSAAKSDIRVNTIIRHYPDGSSLICVAQRRIFRRPGFEGESFRKPCMPIPLEISDPEAAYARDERDGIQGDGGLTAAEKRVVDESRRRARRRAVAAVRDLAYANPMKYFVTLTFDRAKVDRWSDAEVLRVTKNWLDNTVRRHGLAYVLVPERHKDGAIHFHGFFNGAVDGVDSGHRTKAGQIIYNLPRWPWGFTTAIEVYGDYSAAVGYVCKYITKGEEKVGGRWYYHGGELRRPDVEYCNTDWDALSAGRDVVDIPALGCGLLYFETEA